MPSVIHIGLVGVGDHRQVLFIDGPRDIYLQLSSHRLISVSSLKTDSRDND